LNIYKDLIPTGILSTVMIDPGVQGACREGRISSGVFAGGGGGFVREAVGFGDLEIENIAEMH
jgi:hypothetical protein